MVISTLMSRGVWASIRFPVIAVLNCRAMWAVSRVLCVVPSTLLYMLISRAI